MFLESRERILSMIEEIIGAAEDRTDILRAAVAFWGAGSDLLIKDKGCYELLCNLDHPGTNPFVVEKIMAKPNVTFKKQNDLHAKVIIGSAGAVVGSANFSERALGIQKDDTSGWIEAGVLLLPRTFPHAEAGMWFERLWLTATPISPEDLGRAKENWLARGGGQLDAAPELIPYDPPMVPDLNGPELYDEDVFETKPLDKKSRNMTRMASDELVRLYYQAFPDETQNPSTVKVPAHAANLIWVLSGQEMSTNIAGLPTFKSPNMVIERSRDLGTFDKVHAFIEKLAESQRAKPAVRYWAQYYLTLKPYSLGLYRLAQKPE